MIRAKITHWPRSPYGFATADSGLRVFIHEKALPEDIRNAPRFPLLNLRIECDLVEGRSGASTEWVAANVRIIDDDVVDPPPAIAPVTEELPPGDIPKPEELPRSVTLALGMIEDDEPKGKRTKRERLG